MADQTGDSRKIAGDTPVGPQPAGGAGRATPTVDLARLSHELRTPLSAISALAEIMRDERLGPIGEVRYRDYAADIHDSARQALRLLTAYVDAVTADTDSASPAALMEFVEFDPGSLVAGCASALSPLAERAGVRIDFIRSDRLPHLIADRRAVRQIVDNLVANALRFTPPGGAIVVGLTHTVGEALLLEISDTGDGMSEGDLRRARSAHPTSEPFRRRSGGSGIGLPLVHALASALGAGIRIDSQLGTGTRVALSFPPDRLVPV